MEKCVNCDLQKNMWSYFSQQLLIFLHIFVILVNKLVLLIMLQTTKYVLKMESRSINDLNNLETFCVEGVWSDSS